MRHMQQVVQVRQYQGAGKGVVIRTNTKFDAVRSVVGVPVNKPWVAR
jgi:hypothetical protein